MLKLFIVCFIIVYVYAWYREIKIFKHEKEIRIIKQNRKYFNIDVN